MVAPDDNSPDHGHADPYAQIARWYDDEHDPYEDDLQFYRDLAAGAGPTVLEIGCGTGRVTTALARMGRDITGVDPSPAMLARCRARLAAEPPTIQRRVQLVQADARALGTMAPGPFALALIPLNTLAHFVTPADRLAALSGVRERLVPGGQLIVDVDPHGPRRLLEFPGLLWLLGSWEQGPDPLAPTLAPTLAPNAPPATSPAAPEPIQIAHLASAVPAAEADAAIVTHFYDALAPDGTLRRVVARMTLALLTHNEVALTLAHAGFTVESIYGSYELEPYTPAAERAIFVAHS